MSLLLQGVIMNTRRTSVSLDQIRIASPCSARWEDMTGDDRSRLCADCNLHVHNISTMTRDEVEALLTSATEGRVCVRLYRRADGTVLTRDCPVGLARLRAGAIRTAARIAAVIGLVGVGAAMASELHPERATHARLRDLQPFAAIGRRLWPAAYATPTYQTEMGKCCPSYPALQPAAAPVSQENP